MVDKENEHEVCEEEMAALERKNQALIDEVDQLNEVINEIKAILK